MINVMQGRLSPPIDGKLQSFPVKTWADEFRLAKKLGLGGIEWIYDDPPAENTPGALNPLATWAGIQNMLRLQQQWGVVVNSVCADYFVTYPLVRVSGRDLAERVSHLEWLICQCYHAKITKLILPFVDNSAINDNSELRQVADIIRRADLFATNHNVRLYVETNLNPDMTCGLLYSLGWGLAIINYDSGNSAYLGYNCDEEWEAYGKRIGHIHLKDRQYGGLSVPPGEGDADFMALKNNIAKYNYRGDYTLQVARGEVGDEEGWVGMITGQLAKLMGGVI